MDSKEYKISSNSENLRAFFYTDNFVRKDKSLKDISKLIFSDIAYFQFLRNGKCTASNGHFAEKYDKSKSTISKAVSELVTNGYIDSYLDGNRNRTIYVKRSKFALNKPNGVTSDGNNHPDSNLQNGNYENNRESKSLSNGKDNLPEGISPNNNNWRDISSLKEKNLVNDSPMQGYSPIKNDVSQSLLSNKIITTVSEQFSIDDPHKTMVNLLPRLLEQHKHFKIKDIERTLISLINERTFDKIKENISSFFETHLGLKMVSFKGSDGGQIHTDSLKSTYIPSLSEYLILHFYNLAKIIKDKSIKEHHLMDSDLYSVATDTYEIIWHKLSLGVKVVVKGKLIDIREIKGKDPKMPFAYLKIINPESQELIIQVGSKNYQRYIQDIYSGKGEDVAIYGPVQYSKRNDQNIVILFEMQVNTPQNYEEDELNEES